MVKGFEGLETAAVEEVNAMKEMEKAKLEMRDREERKAVTQGADGGPVAPKMNINVSLVLFKVRSLLTQKLETGQQNKWSCEIETSTVNFTKRSIRKSRGIRGEDRPRETEPQRGRQQIWFVNNYLFTLMLKPVS